MPVAFAEPLIDRLADVCARHHIVRLRVFGSTAVGTDRADSDVDLLVDFEASFTPTFFSLDQLERELSLAFNGRRIDVMRPDDVHWFIRRTILESAQTLYEK